MCKCVKELEEKILETVKEQYPEGKMPHASLDGQALRIPRDGSESHWVGYTNINASVSLPVRTATTVMKVKKLKLKMYFTFCPYCGVKYG